MTRRLGFRRIPYRTTIGRWKKKPKLLKDVFNKLADILMWLIPTKFLIVDSTPLEDEKDLDARVGFYSKGPFKGFEAHL